MTETSNTAGIKPRILLTGFGPFPGVPDNASGSLVTALSGHPELTTRFANLRHVVLPTSWEQAPLLFRATLEAFQPTIVLNFGVSKYATGFVIETLARNTASMPDVDGNAPASSTIDATSKRFFTAGLPARALVSTLRRRGYPATRSLNAGRYLCNTLLFETLRTEVRMAGFIHLPARLAGDNLPGVPPCLTWPDAVTGGVTIVQTLAQRHAAP